MLVLSRYENEWIRINDNIRIKVLSIRGRQVRLGFEAPDDVEILREELYQTNKRVECLFEMFDDEDVFDESSLTR